MNLHPLGIVLILVFSGMVWRGDRPTAALGVLGAVCYLTQGQWVNVAGFNFTAIRIVLLIGLLRVRKEKAEWEFNLVDRYLVAYALSTLIIFTIRNGSFEAFIFQAGFCYNLFLSYFVFRLLLPTVEELKSFLPYLALLILPFVLCIGWEAVTGRDLFALFGGVDEYAWAREGHFRARASFRSPITAGGFGAALMPLFVSGYLAGLSRSKMITGMLASVAIVLASHSSGPLMGLVAGMLALGFWPMRYQMRGIRVALSIILVGLHLVMKAPVWFLIARMGELVGGDAYYRAALIDAFVKNFSSWWLLGAETTAGWMPTEINGGADITNQLVAAGVDGGLLTMILFVLLIGKCFQRLGNARAAAEEHSPEDEWIIWGLGASLVAHLTNQTTVTYFDQMHVVWYMALAVIASTAVSLRQAPDEVAEPVEPSEIPLEHGSDGIAGTNAAMLT